MGTLSFCIFDFMTVEVLDSKLVVVSERSRFCPRKMFENLSYSNPSSSWARQCCSDQDL